MKLVCVTLFALLALAAANYSEQEYQFLFTKWATEHNKVYHHDAFFNRFNTFKQNLDKITLHNKGNHSFSMAMNEFGDLSFEEFHDRFTGYAPRARHFARGLNTAPKYLGAALDDAVDWTTKGAVTPVKNQQQCGSCWAFSATGAMEGAWFLKNGDLISLSEQQLVDCSKDFGNNGCGGGLMDDAFEYAIKNGMCQEDAYPYKAADGTCAKTCESVVSFTGFKDVTPGDEEALKQAVALGPVSVAIEADQQVFQFYSGGVLTDSGCGTQLDHGVLVVGYGTDNGQAYWKVKNSWGGSWGEQGYIRIARGTNECGVSADPSYPIAAEKKH